MRQFIISILVSLMLISCLTPAKIRRNKDDILAILGTNNTSIVYKDTTIYLKDTIRISLPKDTVKITNTVNVNNGIASMGPVTTKNGIVSAKAWVFNSKLNVEAWINQPNFSIMHTDTIVVTKIVKDSSTVTTVKEKYIPKTYKYAFWFVLAQIIVIVLYLLYKFNAFGMASKIAKILSSIF